MMTRAALSLRTATEEIAELHKEIRRGIQAGIDKYVRMYELLSAEKKRVGRGKWGQHIKLMESVWGFGERQARLYMRPPALRNADQIANRERVAKHRTKTQQGREKENTWR